MLMTARRGHGNRREQKKNAQKRRKRSSIFCECRADTETRLNAGQTKQGVRLALAYIQQENLSLKLIAQSNYNLVVGTSVSACARQEDTFTPPHAAKY